MNIALWVLTGLLAVAFLAAGAMKAAMPKEQLKEKGMGWVDDFGAGAVKTIGVLEALGAIGLVVPAFVGGLEWLVVAAGIGLAVTMVGAVVVHVRRTGPAAVLAVLTLLVVIGRIWVAPF